MFNLFLRAQANWFGGFGRYADLFLGMMLIVIAWHTQNNWACAFAILGIISFAFDFNGKMQRWMINKSMAKVKAKRR